MTPRKSLLPFCLLLAACSPAEAPPNIIVILADDMGLGDPGCYNPDSKIPTPAMDRLAREGMRFWDAHSPSAVCTPTRYGLLTGRYCWRSRQKRWVLQGYSPALIEEGRTTVASFLKDQGYATYAVGKWHLGLGKAAKTDFSQELKPGPLEIGFDHFFGIPASLDMIPFVYVRDHRVEALPTETIAGSGQARTGGQGFWRGGPMAPGFRHEEVLPRLGQEAVAILENQDGRKPFFLYLPLSAPHKPWVPTQKWKGKSGAGIYGDFVAQVDDVVQQVLQALDRQGLRENTLILVTSDNGAQWVDSDREQFEHLANFGQRGQKADIWEAGHRVPFLARWPGKIPAGSESAALIGLQDLLATVADLHDLPLVGGAGEDSVSFLPHLLADPAATPRPALVHHSGAGMFALRSGNWKLVDGLGSGGFTKPQILPGVQGGPGGQLFNLAEDPLETKNLWLDRPNVVLRLQAELNQIRHGDFTPSYRGLHAQGKTVWASGTGGTVRRSSDGGATWRECSVLGAEELDFRDVQGFGPRTALVLSAGSGEASRIFHTDNGGHDWKQVARCPSEHGFWDGMDFWNEQEGMLVGDPVDGRLDLWRTQDGGRTWEPLPPESRPELVKGEYVFAASGTSICLSGNSLAWIATGGARSRVFHSQDSGVSWTAADTPFTDERPSSGIFSIHMRDTLNGLIVGGNHETPSQPSLLARTRDGGTTWTLVEGGLPGYRSCVQWQEGAWRSTGPSGTDISWDDGQTWQALGTAGFHVLSGRVLAGDGGRLALPLAKQQTNRPNILFFLVDDLGWQDTSVPFADFVTDQNRLYRTPALETLAAQGLKFTQAYTASPVCSPTRTSILSGRNPASTGITNWIPGEANRGPEQQHWALPVWNQAGLGPEDVTLPSILAEHDYRTAHLGKAHFGQQGTPGADPKNLGFQVNIAGNFIGHPGSYYPPYGMPGHSHRVPDLDDLRESDRYLNDALTDKALAVLDTFASDPHGRPFFLHLAHYAVHTPIQGDLKLLESYDKALPKARRHYATMVESYDRSLGRVLNRLDALGLTDHTLVVFFSDNGGLATHAGPPTTCAPLAGGKGTMREGGTRVPMIVRWPGRAAAGASCPTPVISDDFLPTLLAAANLPLPQGPLDGISWLPLLQGKTLAERPLLWHWPHYWSHKSLRDRFDFIGPFSALRLGNWKVVWRWDEQRAELFHLGEDLSETHNRASEEPKQLKRLVDLLAQELRRRDAPRPRDHQTGEPAPWPFLG